MLEFLLGYWLGHRNTSEPERLRYFGEPKPMHCQHMKTNFHLFIVLISSHKEVRDELNKRSIPFTIVLPSLDMKQEMIDRYIKRGNQENFVTMLENNYETFVNDLMSDQNNKIVLDSGQYLKDVVRII